MADQDIVVMRHPDQENSTTEVIRSAYEGAWQYKGWVLVDEASEETTPATLGSPGVNPAAAPGAETATAGREPRKEK